MSNYFEQFTEAYQKASKNTKDLIDSGKIGIFCEKNLKLFDKEAALKPKLIILISNYILGVIDTDKLKLQLVGLGFKEKEVEVLQTKINSFAQAPYTYTNQSDFMDAVEKAVPEKVAQLSSQAPALQSSGEEGAVVESATQTVASTPEQTAPVEQTVKPIRTMEADMDKIHGYGAYRKLYPEANNPAGGEESVIQSTSQADMLKKTPLAPTPTYKEGE